MKIKPKQDKTILPESANDWPEVRITKITAFDMAKELGINIGLNDKEVFIEFPKAVAKDDAIPPKKTLHTKYKGLSEEEIDRLNLIKFAFGIFI